MGLATYRRLSKPTAAKCGKGWICTSRMEIKNNLEKKKKKFTTPEKPSES